MQDYSTGLRKQAEDFLLEESTTFRPELDSKNDAKTVAQHEILETAGIMEHR